MYASQLPKTTVAILGDSRLFRETVGAWLRLQRSIEWVVIADSLAHLALRLAGRAADILLAHTRVDGPLGREVVRKARILLPDTRLIALQTHRGEHGQTRWTEAGAAAYLDQSTSAAKLLQTILDAAQRCPPSSVSRVAREFNWPRPICADANDSASACSCNGSARAAARLYSAKTPAAGFREEHCLATDLSVCSCEPSDAMCASRPGRQLT